MRGRALGRGRVHGPAHHAHGARGGRARCAGARWTVGACTVQPTTLTVRVEDVWRGLSVCAGAYRIDVLRDPHAKDNALDAVVHETLDDVAPDARIFIDLARGGGFILRAEPLEGTTI